MNPDTFTVTGSLRHHFHGAYSATIAIACGAVPAAQVTAQLPFVDFIRVSGDLILLRSNAHVSLEALVQWIEARRIDGPCTMIGCSPCDGYPNGKPRHPIDSIAHGTDHGPMFTMRLPFVDLLTPQLPFAGAK
jgi:hypothetical protein